MLAEQNIIIRPLEERDLPILTRWQSPEFRGAFQECQMESEIERKNQLMENGFCTPQFQMLMIEEDEVASGLIYLNFVREDWFGWDWFLIQKQEAIIWEAER